MIPKICLGADMNKTTSFHIWLVLLAGTVMFMFTRCGVVTPTISPNFQSSTPASPYIHYIPSVTSDVHLEFDYPSSWVFSEEKIRDTDTVVISLADPRFLTIPTRAPGESHGTPSDFAGVDILVQPAKPDQTLDILVEPHKQGYSNASWIMPINDYELTIDGYDAIAFEYQVEPTGDNGYISSMFERNIFFVIKDQLYQITFSIAERERGSEFEQGYEYFFKSLKIVP